MQDVLRGCEQGVAAGGEGLLAHQQQVRLVEGYVSASSPFLLGTRAWNFFEPGCLVVDGFASGGQRRREEPAVLDSELRGQAR